MLNYHGITAARYATPDDTSSSAPVIAVVRGVEQTRRADDDIEGGGMLAYLAGGGTIAPYVAPPSPLATPETISAAKVRVAAFADQMAAAVTGPIPDAERASWPTKEIAARAYLAGNASPSQAAMLQAEADLTGETVQHLAATIVANADSYVAISGMIAGQRRLTMAALDALVIGTATVADVEAVLATARAQAEAMLQQVVT